MRYLKSYELFGGASATKSLKDDLNFDWDKLSKVNDFIENCVIFAEDYTLPQQLSKNYELDDSVENVKYIKLDLKHNFKNGDKHFSCVDRIVYWQHRGVQLFALIVYEKNGIIKRMFSDKNNMFILKSSNLGNRTSFDILLEIKNKLIEMFGNYEFQKEFLTKTPERFRELEIIGVNPKIKDEFSYLFEGDEMGLL